MENQLRGISLILIGILLVIFSIVDPWLPILGGDVGRAMILVLSLVVSIIGLWLCFKRKKDS